MNNEVLKEIMKITFQNHELPVYGTLDNPLFCANDIAIMIDYSVGVIGQMLDKVRTSEKLLNKLYRSGQGREVWCVTTEGLHEILMSSSKPRAQEFKIYVESLLNGLASTKLETLNVIDKGITALKDTGRCIIDNTIVNADNKYISINEVNKIINKKLLIVGGIVIIVAVGSYVGYKIYKKRKKGRYIDE